MSFILKEDSVSISKSHLVLLVVLIFFISCKKQSSADVTPPPPPPPADTTVVIQPAVDPPLATSIGFFMDDWQAKTFTIPAYKDTSATASGGLTINVDASNIITKIPRSIAGNNANLW